MSAAVALLTDPDTVGVLLKEPRRTILEMAREPVSAVEIAERLGQPRQRVGYHVRCLQDAGLLDDVETRTRGAMVEKRYRASADCFALAPELLGALAARVGSAADRESVTYLLGAVNEVQSDLVRVLERRHQSDEPLPTLTLSTRLRFRTPEQRGAFADALTRALTDVVGRFTSPFEDDEGSPDEGEPFRLTLTLHPTEP